MAHSQLLEPPPTATSPSAWAGNKPPKKGPDYYKGLKEQYGKIVTENELLPVPSFLDEVNTKPISLLTTDVKSRKFIGVNRESTEEALKSLNVGSKCWPGEVMQSRIFYFKLKRLQNR